MNVVMFYAPDFRQEHLFLDHKNFNFTHYTGDLTKLEVCQSETNAQLIILVGFIANKTTLNKVSNILDKLSNFSVAIYVDEPSSNFLIDCIKIGINDILTEYSSKSVFEIAEKNEQKFNALLKKKILKQQAVTVLASKGGDGSTLFAANLAACVAKDGDKVLLVDLSLPFGDLDMYVTRKKATYDFVDITNEFSRLDEGLLESMVQKITTNFHLIPAPIEFDKAMTIATENITLLIDLLKKSYDYVFFDVGSNLDPLIIDILARANIIVLVLNRNLPSVRQANQKLNHLMLNPLLASKVKVILNGKEASSELSISDIESALDRTIKQSAPLDNSLIKESLLRGVPAIQINSKSDFARFVTNFAKEITGVEIQKEEESFITRLLRLRKNS